MLCPNWRKCSVGSLVTQSGASVGFEQVGADEEFKEHIFSDVEVGKSGYLYVYVSNATPNIEVFFDNLQLTHSRGPLLETNEYYPFGLLMKNISYRSQREAGFAENKYKYNAGTELNEELDVQYYETPLRNYDPQTGRFNCVDMLAEHYFALTPYQFGFNNPVFFNDPTGALTKAEFNKLIETLWGSNYGGHWSAKENTGTFEYGGGSYSFYGSADEAFGAGAGLMADNGWWGLNKGWATNFESALQAYNGGKFTPGMVTGYYRQKWESQQAYNISSDYSPNGKGFNTVYNSEYIGTMENVISVYSSMQQIIKLFGGYFGGGNGNSVSDNECLKSTQTGLGALDVANGAKEEMIEYAAKSSPTIGQLNYTKAIKVASKGVFAAQAVISIYQSGSAWRNKDSNKWGVTKKASLDIAIGAISLWGGPIGWGIGALYFIGDAAGWWGNWGEPTYSSYHIINP